jgi:hypothetical protein
MGEKQGLIKTDTTTFENNKKIRRRSKTENRFSLVGGGGNGPGSEPSLGMATHEKIVAA